MLDIHLIKEIDSNMYYTYNIKTNEWDINNVNDELTIEDFDLYGMFDLSIVPEESWSLLGNFEIITYTESNVAPTIHLTTFSYWTDTGLTEPLTKEDFELYGMEELDNIPEAAWAELGDFEILTWSNNDVEPEIEIEVPEFRLIDELDDDFEILCYTEGETEPSGTYSYIPNDSYYKYKTYIDDPHTNNTDGEPDLIIHPWSDWITTETNNTIIMPPDTLKHMSPYPITVEVEQLNTSIKKSGSVQIYNVSPTIYGKITAQNINLLIGDPEFDKVKTTIKVNGVIIVENPLETAPYEINYSLAKNQYIIGSKNVIDIEVEDEFGMIGTLSINFYGDYYSMVFCKEDGEILSTDEGVIIEKLNFGTLKPGSSSEILKVFIENRNPYRVEDISVSINQSTIAKHTNVELSKTKSPFIIEDKLAWNKILENKEKIDFYIRVKTDELATETSIFEMITNSKKVV